MVIVRPAPFASTPTLPSSWMNLSPAASPRALEFGLSAAAPPAASSCLARTATRRRARTCNRAPARGHRSSSASGLISIARHRCRENPGKAGPDVCDRRSGFAEVAICEQGQRRRLRQIPWGGSTTCRLIAFGLRSATSSMSMPPSMENSTTGRRATCRSAPTRKVRARSCLLLDQQPLDPMASRSHSG